MIPIVTTYLTDIVIYILLMKVIATLKNFYLLQYHATGIC